jgi:hypothetical protein
MRWSAYRKSQPAGGDDLTLVRASTCRRRREPYFNPFDGFYARVRELE